MNTALFVRILAFFGGPADLLAFEAVLDFGGLFPGGKFFGLPGFFHQDASSGPEGYRGGSPVPRGGRIIRIHCVRLREC